MRATNLFKTGLAALMLSLGVSACGGDEGGNSGGSSSVQSCSHSYDCVNGSCMCSSGPRKNSSCANPEVSSDSSACSNFCNVCS